MHPIKIVWASGHPMAQDQVEDLANLFGVYARDLEIIQVHPTWTISTNSAMDITANSAIWGQLAARAFMGMLCAPIITGVFPQVALEALHVADFSESMYPMVLTPASRLAPELRASPDAPIPFAHLRWVKPAPIF